MIWFHQTSTETFVISMLLRMETEDFAANRIMQKDLKSFDCKPLAWSLVSRRTGWHFAWLLFGFWAQTLKEFNMLQLNKDSMQGQYVSTWSQNESRPKHPKAWWKYGSTKGYAGFCIYVQNQCQSIKLKGTKLDALNSIAFSGHARAADPGQPCVFSVSLSDIKQPSQGIRDWFGEEKEVSRPVLLLCRYRFVQYPGVWFATCCTSMVFKRLTGHLSLRINIW